MKNIVTFLICLLAFTSQGQRVPQYISSTEPILNEFNNILSRGSLIHVYQATDGIIYPPDEFGKPNHKNVLLSTSSIGKGVITSYEGHFSIALIPRPLGGVPIFVRVFNKDTVEASSFYVNSQIHIVSGNSQNTFYVDINSVLVPLDERDVDNDKLNNSWEKSYGTDPNISDTDNDGYSDYQEVVCIGSNPTNELDYLEISMGVTNSIFFINPLIPVQYTVETTTNTLQYSNLIWDIVATNILGAYEITNQNGYQMFRIKVECE